MNIISEYSFYTDYSISEIFLFIRSLQRTIQECHEEQKILRIWNLQQEYEIKDLREQLHIAIFENENRSLLPIPKIEVNKKKEKK